MASLAVRSDEPLDKHSLPPTVSLTQLAELSRVHRNAIPYLAVAYQVPFTVAGNSYVFLRDDAAQLVLIGRALRRSLDQQAPQFMAPGRRPGRKPKVHGNAPR